MPLCSRENCKYPHIKQDILALCFIDNDKLVCPLCATNELMYEVVIGAYKHNNGLEKLNRQSKVLTKAKKIMKHLTTMKGGV